MTTIHSIKETIFHEFGHLLVYIVANKNSETHIGNVKTVQIGLNKNKITPDINLYYFDPMQQNLHIFNNSKNINRTIYWVILQFSGCLFESIYDDIDFNKLFCSRVECHGKTDFDNIYYFNIKSFFKITDTDIERIKSNYLEILYRHNIFEKTEKYLEHFLTIHGSNPQLGFDSDDIETLLEEMEQWIISNEFISDFNWLVDNESKNFL
ncbi:hypothetical protein [Chryseobacterium sp. OV279]|uniref:hypothetical protein n=1 Tax=Chryseobacterium sp. OV279 TaxID=1500285 RepID=UPI00091A864F|nr:hypothetical protein [Chryseobacterium sp. OV279]SHF01411.1 hypothetical protein SAMN02787100_1354 [Chryseobacterium sp. OV279]